MLLDSLQIVDPSRVRDGIRTQIEELESDLRGGTGLLLPVLSIEDINRTLEQLARLSGIEPSKRYVPAIHTAWETFQPGMPILATPGSEGGIGSYVRDLTGDKPGSEPSHWLHPDTGLDRLRDRRCRLLVLLTDYSGSGKQVVQFARTLVRNKHVRSWRSFGWLRVVVIPYALSIEARQLINKSGYVDSIKPAHPAASFDDAAWTPAERQHIERICREYLPGKERKLALGYGGSAGLFLTHTAVPNNLPRILWRRAPGWSALFAGASGRTFPTDLAQELQGYEAPERDLAVVAHSANQKRLSRAIASGRLRTPTDQLVVTLALLAQGGFDVAGLSHGLARPESEIQELVTFLVHSGYVTGELTITPAGRIELQHARRLDRVTSTILSGADDPYYPQALR